MIAQGQVAIALAGDLEPGARKTLEAFLAQIERVSGPEVQAAIARFRSQTAPQIQDGLNQALAGLGVQLPPTLGPEFQQQVLKALTLGDAGKALLRTAKPCGPDRRCHGQVLAKVRASPTGQTASSKFAGRGRPKEWSAPGRSRHKPSDHRAGKAE